MATTTTPALEHSTCGRCGGTGKYSWCMMYGNRCFKCGGRGWHFTKRGAAAAQYLEELRCRPAAEVRPGDVVRFELPTMDGRRAFLRVETVGFGRDDRYKRLNRETGEWETDPPAWTLTATHPSHGRLAIRVADGGTVRMGWTREEKSEQLRQAIAYQATLTKAGKPRKRGSNPESQGAA